jgi:hypothetical protein
LPKDDTNVTSDQKRKKKKKAVDAIIKEDGQTREVTIKYDDGSTEKFNE